MLVPFLTESVSFQEESMMTRVRKLAQLCNSRDPTVQTRLTQVSMYDHFILIQIAELSAYRAGATAVEKGSHTLIFQEARCIAQLTRDQIIAL